MFRFEEVAFHFGRSTGIGLAQRGPHGLELAANPCRPWHRRPAGRASAFVVGSVLRAQREEIIATGPRVPARVVDTRKDLSRSRQHLVEYTAGGQTHRVEISDTWNSRLEKGSRVELHFQPSDPDSRA